MPTTENNPIAVNAAIEAFCRDHPGPGLLLRSYIADEHHKLAEGCPTCHTKPGEIERGIAEIVTGLRSRWEACPDDWHALERARRDAETPYVWVNRLRTRFHLYESCAAGQPTRMTLDAALRRGVRPCKVCKAERLLTPTGGPDGQAD